MKEEGKRIIYCLSKKMIIALFVYYFLLMIIGGGVTILIARNITTGVRQEDILLETFGASLAVSVMLCGMRYVKKLYKACLMQKIQMKADICDYIGNMAYFLFRPLFACAFAVIMIFALLSGMFVVTGALDYILNEKFLYLCVILSSFLGYSVGKVLDRFEHTSDKTIVSFK